MKFYHFSFGVCIGVISTLLLVAFLLRNYKMVKANTFSIVKGVETFYKVNAQKQTIERCEMRCIENW